MGDGWVWPWRRRSQCRLGRRRHITAAVPHEVSSGVTAAEAATIFYLVEGSPVSRGSKWTMLVERLATIATIDQGSERRAQPQLPIAMANDPRDSHRRPNPSTHETKTNMPSRMAFQKDPVR